MSIQCAYPYDGQANQRTVGNPIQRQKGERDRERQIDRQRERERNIFCALDIDIVTTYEGHIITVNLIENC